MQKTMHGLARGSASGGRLSVLIFHRVLAAPDPLFPGEIDAAGFSAICGWLRRWFNVLPLPDALRRLDAGRLPPRACAITFDDGYADNHDVALPILIEHGLSATFFIATGYLDGGRMWNDTVIEAVRATQAAHLDLGLLLPCSGDGPAVLGCGSLAERRSTIDQILRRIKYLPAVERLAAADRIAQLARVRPPDDLMLSSVQLQQLHTAGMQIGAHTVTHPILATLDAGAARREILQGKDMLENLIDERVGLFAYPNGKPGTDYHNETIALTRSCGFDAAFSTAWGAVTADTDRFQLPRFTPWDRSQFRFGLRLMANFRRQRTEPALLLP